jgi:hypothetical protein
MSEHWGSEQLGWAGWGWGDDPGDTDQSGHVPTAMEVS